MWRSKEKITTEDKREWLTNTSHLEEDIANLMQQFNAEPSYFTIKVRNIESKTLLQQSNAEQIKISTLGTQIDIW